MIGKRYGDRYVPSAPRVYTSKAKTLRKHTKPSVPTSFDRIPEEIARSLDSDQLKLYELIWKRAVASQMKAPNWNAPRSM